MKTEIFTDDMTAAAEIIRRGGLVAVPTETVYGLAGNGLDEKAVREIYEVKGRPEIKPLSLMVHDESSMERYCENVPEQAHALAKKYWPGPLTIVLKSKETVPHITRAGGATVGLRCPDHPLTLELLSLAEPLAAPSANPSGEPSPKNAAKVKEYFDGKIDGIIDGGECGIGRESTIIDMSAAPYKILRVGALTQDEVFSALAESMTVVGITGGTGSGKTTALNVLREMGAGVIDCDEVYHELTNGCAEMKKELCARFGEVYNGETLDRKKLGEAVFCDENALLELNAITHKYVGEEVSRRLCSHAANGGTLAAIDAIALIESGIGKMCTTLVGVKAPEKVRVARIMQREGISEQYAKMRIAAQKPDSFFEQSCDYILENNGDISAFTDKCRTIFTEVLKK